MKKLSVLFFALTLVSCGNSGSKFTTDEVSAFMYGFGSYIGSAVSGSINELAPAAVIPFEDDCLSGTVNSSENSVTTDIALNECAAGGMDTLECTQDTEELTLSGNIGVNVIASESEATVTLTTELTITGGALNGKTCSSNLTIDFSEILTSDEGSNSSEMWDLPMEGTLCGIDAATLIEAMDEEATNEDICESLFTIEE